MEFGEPKSSDDITFEDALANPIWSPVWAIGLEDEYPEDYQAPLLNEIDVNDSIDQPIITLKVNGTDLYASGEFDWDSESLTTFAIWHNNSWALPNDIDLNIPLILTAIPTIQGERNLKFECLDLESEVAKLKG